MPFDKKPIEDFIGSGLVFPIILQGGRPPISSGFELIRSSIKNILSWPYGHRFYLCEFGSRIEELLEEPNDEILKQIIRTFVIDPINMWENRILLLDTVIEDVEQTKIRLYIKYQIVNSKVEDSFVFPFYRKIIY